MSDVLRHLYNSASGIAWVLGPSFFVVSGVKLEASRFKAKTQALISYSIMSQL